MRDRERKREADRVRRTRIKAGTWGFPNGGEADRAKAGAAVLAPLKPALRQSQPVVFAPAPRPRPTAPAPSHALAAPVRVAVPAPAPASMVAIGGRPGRGLVPQGYGYAAPPDIAAVSTFTKWRSNTETMLAALAAKADAQERRIAALEAVAADRRANALAVVQAIAGLFSLAVRPSNDSAGAIAHKRRAVAHAGPRT